MTALIAHYRAFWTPARALQALLGVNAVCFLLQVLQARAEQVITREAFFQFAVFAGFALSVLMLAALAILRFDVLQASFGAALRWVLAQRLRTWVAALLVFIAFNAFADLFRGGVFPFDLDLIRALGFVNAVALLIAGTPVNDTPGTAPSRRFDLFATLLIAGTALFVSLWQFAYAPPAAPWNDSLLYFTISQQLLGRDVSGLQDLNNALTYLYGYPLFLAGARLIADSLIFVVLIQHTVRALTALAIYWVVKQDNRVAALVAALFTAAVPMTASFAHIPHMDSLYSSVLTLLVLFTYYTIRRSNQRPAIGFLVLTGVLCTLALFVRFTALLVVVPIVFAVFLFTRTWWKPVVVAITAGAAALLLLGMGRLFVAPDFTLGTRSSDVYFAIPLLYYDLIDLDSSILPAPFDEVVNRSDCAFRQVANTTLQAGYKSLFDCTQRYNATAAVPASIVTLYLQSILAQPGKFLDGYLMEFRQFYTHADWAITVPQMRPGLNQLIVHPPPQPCQDFYPERNITGTAVINFACDTVDNARLNVPGGNLFPAYTAAFAEVLQPYRLFGQEIGVRFWGAGLLLGFVLVIAPAMLRPLLLTASLVIAYHSALTPFSQLVTARYVYVLAPLFAILSATLFYVVGRELFTLYQTHLRALLPARPFAVGAGILASVLGIAALMSYQTPLPVQFAASANAQRVNVLFDSSLRLLGYRVDDTPTLAGEKRLQVILNWYVETQPALDYHIFVHVFAPDSDTRLAQNDVILTMGQQTTTNWLPGTLYAQTIDLPADPPRPLHVRIGLYDPTTGARAFLTDGLTGQWLSAPGDNSLILTVP